MYKCTDNTQSNFLSFNQPIGLHMNPENRWVKMADAIPWEIFEKKYSRLFKGKNGRVAKPLRLALGSLIIQTKYQYSDRELVDQFPPAFIPIRHSLLNCSIIRVTLLSPFASYIASQRMMSSVL